MTSYTHCIEAYRFDPDFHVTTRGGSEMARKCGRDRKKRNAGMEKRRAIGRALKIFREGGVHPHDASLFEGLDRFGRVRKPFKLQVLSEGGQAFMHVAFGVSQAFLGVEYHSDYNALPWHNPGSGACKTTTQVGRHADLNGVTDRNDVDALIVNEIHTNWSLKVNECNARYPAMQGSAYRSVQEKQTTTEGRLLLKLWGLLAIIICVKYYVSALRDK